MNDWAILEANVSRKAKIGMAVAFVLLVLFAWALWPGQDEGTVTVTYAGVLTNDTNSISFFVSNHYKETVHCRFVEQDLVTGLENPDIQLSPRVSGILPSTHGQTVQVSAMPEHRWQLIVRCYAYPRDTFLFRTRQKLGYLAADHDWPRLGRWIAGAKPDWLVSGPIMLGNQPVAPGSAKEFPEPVRTLNP